MFEAFNGTFLVDEINSAKDTDAIIFGMPIEDNVDIYQKGTYKAPEVIREQSHFFSGQGIVNQSIHSFNVLDFGNCYQHVEQEERVENIINKNAIPIILGGDHSIALSTAKGVNNAKTKIDSLIWLDAHLDLMMEYPEGCRKSRATVLKRILELDFVKPSNLYFIGVRGHNIGQEEVEIIKQMDINYLSAQEMTKLNIVEKFINDIRSKSQRLYLSLDMDVLDPAFAPGVSVPEPGGITTRELLFIVGAIASSIKCLEIVEVNPLLDVTNNITSKIACSVIYHFFEAKKR